MRVLLAVSLMLLFATALSAQDEGKSDTSEQAADRVLRAFNAKAEKALKALAGKDDPDPWLIADELCYRGKYDAAEAFARAAPRKAVKSLPDYVASRRRGRPDRKVRAALSAMNDALGAQQCRAPDIAA